MFIYMLIYVSSAKKLIKNSYFVAVGIWCGCIWVEIWGNHQRCFDCPGVQGKTFRSWNIWGLDWNVCNKCCLWEERCALCEALGVVRPPAIAAGAAVRPPAIAAGASAVWNWQSLGQHSVGQRTHWEKISFSSGIWAGHHHTHQPEDIISKVRKYGDHVIMSMIIRWSQWYQHNNDKIPRWEVRLQSWWWWKSQLPA